MDAYQLSQAVESPLVNVCDTNYTSVADIGKRSLPERAGALAGVHDKLRDVGPRIRRTAALRSLPLDSLAAIKWSTAVGDAPHFLGVRAESDV